MKRLLLLLLLGCKIPVDPGGGGPATVTGKVELVLAPVTGEEKRSTRAGVKVVLEGLYTNVTETDDLGDYRFEGIPSGRYTVRASYGEFTREGEVTAPVEALPNVETAAPPLALTPAGTIVGRARLGGRDAGNLGIRVSVDGTDIVTTTDDSGGFIISRVPEGSYRVRVEKLDYGGRTRRGIEVLFGETTMMETIDIAPGIFSDFNNPPVFPGGAIALARSQIRPGTLLQPLPLDLAGDEVSRFDTIALSALADDIDGDRLTYFWSVTAGTLDRTDEANVSWTVDDDAALGATVTVRVVDERSGAAYLSRQLTIIDTQTMSGHVTADRILYAYRPFSGMWRVLDYDRTSKTVTRVGELDSLDDPKVMRLGDVYAATPFSDGDRTFVTWTTGTPAVHDFPGQGPILPHGTRAVRMFNTTGKLEARVYDPATNAVTTLFSCGAATCGDLATARPEMVVSVNRGTTPDADPIVHTWNGALSSFSRSGAVGARIRSDGLRLAFNDLPPGFERGGRNSILRAVVPGGSTNELYFGLYDVFLGAYDGRFIGFTEQEFRVVYSPERAYLYDSQKNAKIELDPSEEFAYDEVVDISAKEVVVRRYSRADWLRDENRTHYELCTRALPE